MPAPFAALETRVNRAVADRLANAEMVFVGGTVAVVFERDDQGVPNALGGPRNLNLWRAGAPAADFTDVAPATGSEATIHGVRYGVTQIDTDASDWMTLTLRKVA